MADEPQFICVKVNQPYTPITDEQIDAALAESRGINGCDATRDWCCSYHDGFLDGLLHAQGDYDIPRAASGPQPND